MKKKSFRRKGRIKDARYTPEYWVFRKEVLRRDCYLCQFPLCHHKDKTLEVHHIRKYATEAATRTEKFNGITLCKTHHLYITGKEEQYETLFFKIVNANNIKELGRINDYKTRIGLKKSNQNSKRKPLYKRDSRHKGKNPMGF